MYIPKPSPALFQSLREFVNHPSQKTYNNTCSPTSADRQGINCMDNPDCRECVFLYESGTPCFCRWSIFTIPDIVRKWYPPTLSLSDLHMMALTIYTAVHEAYPDL